MMKAKNIQWDFDMDEVFERMDTIKPEDVAESIGVPIATYNRMTTSERHDLAYDAFHHCPALLDEFMELPDAIEIPKALSDPEDISEWLSDEYGFCHKGFQLTMTCPKCGKELCVRDDNGCLKVMCDDCNIRIELNPDMETPVSANNGFIRADWYDAGEGLCGDYREDDPEDIHLLRFDVYKKSGDDWVEVEDASYCTGMPADADVETLIRSILVILKEYNDALDGNPDRSVKKLGEALSWICPADFS